MLRAVGNKASIFRRVTKEDVLKFTELSGDVNPIHADNNGQRALVHGALLNAFVSRAIGTKMPGPGSVVISQNLNFPNKCYVGDEMKISVEMVENRKIIRVKFVCEVPARDTVVLFGDARLIVTKTETVNN